MDRQLILGIDFNNIFFASSYEQPLINNQGFNVNAIKGFFFKIRALRDTFSPDYIIFGSDLERSKTFRRKLYKPYKAQRKSHDPQIMDQMKYALQITDLLGFPIINNELYEADDILGMISKWTSERDIDFIIASSDRDLYQLVNETTYIYSPKSKEVVDKLYLQDNYKLAPEQWVELKMLQGDQSDNIPGIPGIGKVTALKLMQQYGSIDEIYNHLNQLKPGIKEKLENNKEVLPLTRELVTILTDYNLINFNENMLERKEIFRNEVLEIIEKLEIYSLHDVMNFSLFKTKGEL